MPDLYPVPGFGPDEILEMARSAIRQVKDYKITIALTERKENEHVHGKNHAIGSWQDVYHQFHGKKEQVRWFLVPAAFPSDHVGIFSWETEQQDFRTDYAKRLGRIAKVGGKLIQPRIRLKGKSLISESHPSLKIAEKIHSS